jgi:hypothetical protein
MGNLDRCRALQLGVRRRSPRWRLFVAARPAEVHRRRQLAEQADEHCAFQA